MTTAGSIRFHFAIAVIAALLPLLTLTSTAAATTYYVAPSPTGNDSNSGLSGSPWATLQHAVDAIGNGDTILVANGTYTGCYITSPGASGAVKTLKNQTAGQGVIVNARGANPHNAVMDIDGTSYWVIDGLVINGMSSYTYGFFTVLSDHITIKNCVAHGAVMTNFLSGFSDYLLEENNEAYTTTIQHGFYNGDSDNYTTERGNISHDNTLCAFHHNGGAPDGGDGTINYLLSERNTAYGNGGAVMNMDGVVDSKIINNLAYGNRHLGVALYMADGAVHSDRNLIYNNTFHFSTAGYDCVSVGNGCVNNKIKNNILIQERTGYGSVSAWSTSITGFESDYNVVVDRFSVNEGSSYISLATWRGYGWDTHSLISTASALFVTPGSDYHLKAGSPAINAGTALAEVTIDKDGNARPQGGAYDIGCYESAGSSPLTITTSSLPADTVGIAYSQTLAATGGATPYTWSMNGGSLPAGLSLSSGGVISGTPTTAGTANFTVKVTDNAAATAGKALSIVVNAAVSITTSSLPADTVGIAYSQTLSATGGTGTKTWSLNSGSLPAGLSLSSGGVISGTPTTAGTSNFTVRAQDTLGASATKALSILINAAPSITTSSLPNGTVGTAYSQTLVATGGTSPLSWSLQSGTLPAGLSLAPSTGVISGTPTSAGTSNFTAKVQDNVSASATKALSIVISSGGGTSATYQFVASDSESSTTSTTFQTKATLTFTPNAADDWIILGFAEIKESSTSYQAKAQLVVDGTVEGLMQARPKVASDYMSMSAAKFTNLTAASHTITLQYASSSASGTAYVRNARIVALRKSTIAFYQTASDSTTALTTTMTNYATLTFTPAATNDYLYIWSAEVSANTSYYTQLQATYDSVTYDQGTITAINNGDYTTFMSFAMFTPNTSAHTATLQAAKQSGSGATHNIRRARIMAIQLSGGRFANYWGGASDAESTTTSTSFVVKKSVTWTQGNNGNWLLLNSARVSNSSTSYQTEVRSYLNSSIVDGQELRQVKATSDYLNFTAIDVRNLTTSRTHETDYRTTNASGTAKIKYARLYELPLD